MRWLFSFFVLFAGVKQTARGRHECPWFEGTIVKLPKSQAGGRDKRKRESLFTEVGTFVQDGPTHGHSFGVADRK